MSLWISLKTLRVPSRTSPKTLRKNSKRESRILSRSLSAGGPNATAATATAQREEERKKWRNAGKQMACSGTGIHNSALPENNTKS